MALSKSQTLEKSVWATTTNKGSLQILPDLYQIYYIYKRKF